MLAAVAAACRERPHPGAPPSIRHLRRRTATLLGELSLRRWLDHHHLPYDLRLDTPLTAPEHPQLYLGGRRAELLITLTPGHPAARASRHRPHRLLAGALSRPAPAAPGLPPAPQDVLVFGALTGLAVPDLPSDPAAAPPSLPCPLVASPPEWFRNHLSRASAVEVRHLGYRSLELRIVAWRGTTIITHHLSLQPQCPSLLAGEIGHITWLHAPQPPDGPLLMTVPSRLHWKLRPTRWHTVGLHSAEILLVGWCTRQELEALLLQRLHAARPACLADLHPLADLAARLRRP